MVEDTLLELRKAHREGQEKYTYFLLAAVGACIAFAMSQTQTATLSCAKIPLGLAVICWGLSFYCGCRHLWNAREILHQNYQMLRIEAGQHPNLPSTPELIKWLEERIESNAKKSVRPGQWQFNFLIMGAVFYLSWHVWEMYERTNALTATH